MTLLAQTFYLGANASVQAVRFALCLALGLVSGIIALLYLRKARPVERALTDFFATVCIGALFAVCVEFFLDGKFELYGLAAYVLGLLPIPLIVRKLLAKKRPSSGEPQTTAETPESDGKITNDNAPVSAKKDTDVRKNDSADKNRKFKARRRK